MQFNHGVFGNVIVRQTFFKQCDFANIGVHDVRFHGKCLDKFVIHNPRIEVVTLADEGLELLDFHVANPHVFLPTEVHEADGLNKLERCIGFFFHDWDNPLSPFSTQNEINDD